MNNGVASVNAASLQFSGNSTLNLSYDQLFSTPVAALNVSGALTWVEAGGPPVVEPQRRGFGSVVLKRMATHGAKNATLSLDFPPEGVRWRMEVPAADVLKR